MICIISSVIVVDSWASGVNWATRESGLRTSSELAGGHLEAGDVEVSSSCSRVAGRVTFD